MAKKKNIENSAASLDGLDEKLAAAKAKLAAMSAGEQSGMPENGKKQASDEPKPGDGLDGLDAKLAKAQAKLAAMAAGENAPAADPEKPKAEAGPKSGDGLDGLDAKLAKAQAKLAAMAAGENAPATDPEKPKAEAGSKSGDGLDGLDAKLVKAQAKLAAMAAGEKSPPTSEGDRPAGDVKKVDDAQPAQGFDEKLAAAQAKLAAMKAAEVGQAEPVPAAPGEAPAPAPTAGEQAKPEEKSTQDQRSASRGRASGDQDHPERLLPRGTVRRLKVLADKDQLLAVRNFVSRFGPLMGLSSRQTNRLRMCIDEAFTNIFRHAYTKTSPGEEAGPQKIERNNFAVIEMRNTAKAVEIRCIDWGKEFIIDKGKITAPDLQKYVEVEKKGGLGLFMINKFTNYWELKRVKDKNILLMQFVPEFRPESFFVLVRRNLAWKRMSLRLRFSIVLLLVFSAVLMSFYAFAVQAQRRSLLAQDKGNALAGLAEMSMNAAQLVPADPKKEPDFLGLSVMLQEVMNSNSAVLAAGVIRSNTVIAQISSNRVSVEARRYDAPSPPPLELGWLSRRYKEWISPIVESIERSMPAAARYLDWMVVRGLSVETNMGFVVRDYREAGILHFSGQWKWGGRVFLTLSKAGLKTRIGAYQSRLLYIILFVSFLVLAFLMVYWLGFAFLNPLRDFVLEMRRLAREGLKARLDLKSKSGMYEVNELESLVNTLIEQASVSIAQSKTKLAEQEVRLKENEEVLTDATRMKSEIMFGQQVQMSLLPKDVPDIEGYEIGAEYIAATELGGDYYDYIKMSDHALGLVVGDVSGHGLPSAMMMIRAQTALYTQAPTSRNAAQVLIRVNHNLMGKFPKGMYITMYYVFLDAKRREINYASAGHNPMILFRGDTQQVYHLNPKGFAIGLDIGSADIFEKAIRSESIKLKKGDLLFIYTDGITEAMNEKREEYGELRLINAIRKFHEMPARDMAKAFLADINEFTQGFPQGDDITFIILKEQSSVTDIEYNKRIRLFELIEKEKISPTAACRQTGISLEKYKQLEKRKKRLGLKALKEDIDEGTRAIDRLDIESSAKLLHLVASHPEYSIEELQKHLDTELYSHFKVETLPISRELKRLNLTTVEKRQRFARREKQLAERGRKKSVFIRSSVFLNPSAVPPEIPVQAQARNSLPLAGTEVQAGSAESTNPSSSPDAGNESPGEGEQSGLAGASGTGEIPGAEKQEGTGSVPGDEPSASPRSSSDGASEKPGPEGHKENENTTSIIGEVKNEAVPEGVPEPSSGEGTASPGGNLPAAVEQGPESAGKNKKNRKKT